MRALAHRLSGATAALEERMAEALASAVARAAEAARANAPVDTGALRGSIDFSARGLTARLHADAPYAALVEYGSRRMPPRPFLRPAALAAREELLARARAALKEI